MEDHAARERWDALNAQQKMARVRYRQERDKRGFDAGTMAVMAVLTPVLAFSFLLLLMKDEMFDAPWQFMLVFSVALAIYATYLYFFERRDDALPEVIPPVDDTTLEYAPNEGGWGVRNDPQPDNGRRVRMPREEEIAR